jgi:hypothetical protein
MNDRLIDVTGGYGTIYKQVMKEPKLSIEAKALYCYYTVTSINLSFIITTLTFI